MKEGGREDRPYVGNYVAIAKYANNFFLSYFIRTLHFHYRRGPVCLAAIQ